jgi:hypothetical protein
MNLVHKNREILDRFNDIANKAIKSVLIPLVTRQGIRVGEYNIVSTDGVFDLRRKDNTYYTVYSKSTAMVLAGMLSKKVKVYEIMRIVEADRVANAMRNKIIFYKYHHDLAVQKNDDMKRELMASRYEDADDKYQEARHVLLSSYSKIF